MTSETKPAMTATTKLIPTKAGRNPNPRTQQFAASDEKLLCRYCGTDDLAPSFIKRRDARCRACFRKRYGSAKREKKAASSRKTKAAK
jgi:hypothetical protein